VELERVVGEPAVLASCVSFASWDSTVWSGGLPGPMKAVVVRNTILIPDAGCKGEEYGAGNYFHSVSMLSSVMTRTPAIRFSILARD